jgi:adenylosuccinate synthase
MKNIKVVIGANFGDESKGLATDYFADKAIKEGSCIVICSNGGSQKGHTVTTPNGIRHITHHFGSGVLVGADTYLSSEFIINPMIFRIEREELIKKGITPKPVYVNNNCRFTTPYDMLINQIVENYRSKDKHGSCGLGIYETIVRNDLESRKIKLNMITSDKLRSQLILLRNYYILSRLEELGVNNISEKEQQIISSELLITNYVSDFEYFLKHSIIVTDDNFLCNYDTVIFECSQGLLLDKDNKEYYPHLTPSNTGIKNPVKILSNLPVDGTNLELCYVSRTYLTRHGVGRFDTECDKSEISDNLVDKTNVPNPYQDTLRYGKIDIQSWDNRIFFDVLYNISPILNKIENAWVSYMFTHLNETNNMLITTEGNIPIVQDDTNRDVRYYVSDGETRDSVRILYEGQD